jgi:flagellar M-ring protein FliF
LFQDYSGGAKELLFDGDSITSGEANRMQAAIAQAGLNDAERQGNQILVPRGQRAVYRAAVADANALPADLDTILLDESAEIPWLADGKTRDARMKAAREQALSMMIREMDGVDEAKVFFDYRPAKGFGTDLTTAVVSVRTAPGEELTSSRIKAIRSAVAGATAGLNPKDVAILNARDGSRDDGGSSVSADDFDDPYYQTRTTYELHMKTRIEDLLRYIPGLRVQVTAELDDTLEAQSRAISSSGETQTMREETDTTTITDTQLEDRGRPGPTAQANTRTPPDEAVARNEHKTETNVRDASSFVPTNDETLRRAGLLPKEVRAAISVPSDYIVSIWRQQNPDVAVDEVPPAAQIEGLTDVEVRRLENQVSTLLPRLPENAPYPNVRVTVYQSLEPEAMEEPSMLAKAMFWASSNSGSLIMAGLAVVSLVMLRGVVKSIPAAETNVILTMPGANDMGAGAIAGGESDGGAGGDFAGAARGAGGDKSRPRLRLKKGPSLKDDLTDMVRDDPDAAAAILRTWISTAG